MTASVATYPHEVVRTRLQTQRRLLLSSGAPRKRSGIINTTRKIIHFEGWRGLYKGLSVNLIRTVPNSAVTMLTCVSVLPELPRVARVMMYPSSDPLPQQIRIVDAPALCTKEITSNSWADPAPSYSIQFPIPTPAPPSKPSSPRAFTLTDATNSIYWKQCDLYISAAACMYYFTFFIVFLFFFSRADPPDVVVRANVRHIAKQRCFLNTNEIIYISTSKFFFFALGPLLCDHEMAPLPRLP